jgi:hypothetical protein
VFGKHVVSARREEKPFAEQIKKVRNSPGTANTRFQSIWDRIEGSGDEEFKAAKSRAGVEDDKRQLF